MKRDQSLDVLMPTLGLAGVLTLPENARGLVAFAHGSGSSRFSTRSIAVARGLNARDFPTYAGDQPLQN
ncbi:hypothetical protein [Bradyrhizobium sp. I71]|uniref:hypothetical protein n=1 Tax=Bradyrhizobium sp. I71 TaxID=2590772 RepID=UPI001EF76586|nr:hypothetical protein [Bradyrhizobium sp. I71]ULK98746.1 hypothetical protein FJV43_03040 [Bradyrhizobium sp. I71]